MKTKNLLFYVYLNIRKNLVKRFFSFLLLTTSFCMVALLSLYYLEMSEKRAVLEQCIVGGLDAIGVVNISKDNIASEDAETYVDRQRQFVNAMDERGLNLGIIDAGFAIRTGAAQLAEQQHRMDVYKDISKMYESTFEALEEDEVILISIFGDYLKLFHAPLQEGTTEGEPKDDEVFLYLGANYTGIPIGTEFHLNYNERYGFADSKTEAKGIVKGYFQKGSKIFSDDMAYGIHVKGYHYTMNLDDKIVASFPLTSSNGLNTVGFFQKNGKSDEEIRSIMTEIGKKTGISLGYVPFDEMLSIEKSDNDIFLNNIFLYCLFIFLISICICVCNTMAEWLNCANVKGIWLANGFSFRDILKIEMIDGVISGIASFACSILFTVIMVLQNYSVVFTGVQKYMDVSGVLGKTCVILSVFEIILLIIISGTRIIMLKNKNVRSYLEG